MPEFELHMCRAQKKPVPGFSSKQNYDFQIKVLYSAYTVSVVISVSSVTDYGLDWQGLVPKGELGYLSSAQQSIWLWDLLIFVSKGFIHT